MAEREDKNMTEERAQAIINAHQKEKFFSVSLLQVGEVELGIVTENGFVYSRKTDYSNFIGIYEENYESDDIYDYNAYTIAELVIKRY